MERKLKKIPVFMDILYDDFLTDQEVKIVVEKVSAILAGSKDSLKIKENTPKQIRLMVLGNTFIQNDLATNETLIQDLTVNFIKEN